MTTRIADTVDVMRVVTFRVERDDEATVIDTLTEVGFTFAPSRELTTTLLDTFDGRLHRAGLRLQLDESESSELVLSGDQTAPAHLACDAPPRVPGDLPPGPFRSRLAATVDVRALLPQLRVHTMRTSGTLRDTSGKAVAVVELNGAIQVVDAPDIDVPASTIEVHEVAGYSKQSDRTIDALRGVGAAEYETDTLSQCATAAGVDLGGFASSATVPLDPEMAAIDGYRAVLANLASTITAHWSGTIDRSDPEFLHDLRIAIRRTRTVLAEGKAVLPSAVLVPARDGFARLADLTGSPRDLDVYLLEWSRYTDLLGADVASSLEPVRDLLERRRTDAHVVLERAMRSDRAAELMAGWQSWLARPLSSDDLALRADRPLGRHVAARIRRAHRVVIEHGRMIGPDTPAEHLHDLRKDAKRLRYLLECFGSLLPPRPRKQYVKRLKALQDNLGAHQDAEVHVGLLRAVARELHEAGAPPETMVAIGQLTERLDQQRLAERGDFAERFAGYDTPATQRALDAVLAGIST